MQGKLGQPPLSKGGHQPWDEQGPQNKKETKHQVARGCWGWQGPPKEQCPLEGGISRAQALLESSESHTVKKSENHQPFGGK